MSQFGDDEPEGSYAIFFAEGEMLAKQRQFQKAVESHTKVLTLYLIQTILVSLFCELLVLFQNNYRP